MEDVITIWERCGLYSGYKNVLNISETSPGGGLALRVLSSFIVKFLFYYINLLSEQNLTLLTFSINRRFIWVIR